MNDLHNAEARLTHISSAGMTAIINQCNVDQSREFMQTGEAGLMLFLAIEDPCCCAAGFTMLHMLDIQLQLQLIPFSVIIVFIQAAHCSTSWSVCDNARSDILHAVKLGFTFYDLWMITQRVSSDSLITFDQLFASLIKTAGCG